MLTFTALALVPMRSVIDWVNETSTDATGAMRNVGILIAVVIFVVAAAASRGAISRILMAVVVAGLIVWGLSSMHLVAGMFGDTVK